VNDYPDDVQISRRDDEAAIHSLPNFEGIIQQPDLLVEDSEVETLVQNADDGLRCSECGLTFPKPYLLNKHRKKHNPPFKCTIDQCEQAFQFKKDLKRHQDARHTQSADGVVLLCCPYSGCKFSSESGYGSSRKDNLRRHIRNQHGG
jgi:hypothetical protein